MKVPAAMMKDLDGNFSQESPKVIMRLLLISPLSVQPSSSNAQHEILLLTFLGNGIIVIWRISFQVVLAVLSYFPRLTCAKYLPQLKYLYELQ